MDVLSRDSRRTPGVFAVIGVHRDGPDRGGMVLKESEGWGTGREG